MKPEVMTPRITVPITVLRIDAYYQEIIKGIVIITAVIADQYRQRKRLHR